MSESLKFSKDGQFSSHEEHELGRLQHIVDFTFTQLYLMIHNRNPIEDYIKYQQYTSDDGALGPLAARLAEIGKPIQIGERVPFVIVNYPGEETRKSYQKKADKYRHFEAIGENDTIDIESYLKDLEKPINNLICARYQNSKIYEQFFEKKQVLKKIIAILSKRGLIPEVANEVKIASKKFKSNGDLDEYILASVLHNMKDPAVVNTLPIGKSYTDLMRFRDSMEYKEVNRSGKASLTRALKSTVSRGLTLALAIPTLISNIVLARDLGILDDYTRIMMSDAAFLALKSM
jgi:hypothetical protein